MQEKSKFVWVIVLLVVGIGARLLPHYPNVTPLESIALLTAAYMGRKYWAVFLPLIMWYAADLILNNTILRGFYPETEGVVWYSAYMMYNFISLIVIVFLGKILLQKISATRVALAAFLSSIIFFLITNAGVWLSPLSLYPKGIEGLWMSYIAGLPFLLKSVMGNLLFSGILFGTMYILTEWISSGKSSTSDL